MDLDRIAIGWIRYWRGEETLADIVPGDLDATETFDDLVREDPERGLDVILKVLKRVEPSPESSLFQVLAAGPLEELLVHHGPAVIDRVEALARADAPFNLLLGGVRPNAIAGTVWARVEQIRRDVW